MASKSKKGAVAGEQPGVFVYIGPNIKGAVQEGQIFGEKTITEVKTELAAIIGRYPQIEALIVPMEALAQSRSDVKHSGTLLHRKYMELLSAE